MFFVNKKAKLWADGVYTCVPVLSSEQFIH